MARLRRSFRLSVDSRLLSPPAILAFVYGIFILLGAALLWLPISNNGTVTFGDALFTAASAVTVTGLVVVDTGSAYALLGQIIIAVLIQLGGLGLMTFAVLLLSMLGIAVALPQRIVLRDEVGQVSLSELGALVRIVFIVAAICQTLGTAVLMFVFVPEFGWSHGFWQALFHAISAFNNAGFSLFSDSLSGYVCSPTINITISLMFIIGGLGFIVLIDLFRVRSWHRLALHSKLMLVGTGALILAGWIGFALMEWSNPNTLAGLDSFGAKLLASWFQAVTPRTAGFNTLDYAQMHDGTTIMTMTLMIIGGGPTSTAGGIKVTTLIVLALATVAFLQQRDRLHIFGRSLAMEEIIKVLALVALSLFIILTGLFLMSLTYQGDFLDLLFEVASAFGTVGLSRGATAELDTFGRMVIIMIMFIGRLGPLTLGFLLATRASPRVRYPEGKVLLG
ncbi:Ktr system potassium uptake protein B (plasmid) [Roseobacter fucihabitans]|uniref:Ktr system potassium uptake protein B n=1 Tax=Roseobacter fucihabitans TaxID=1537242 RepID=A0ABZ2C2U3_9RHOB|nr:TrkH family potassium uptake protein [Roseobacter litoralis]MBC6967954.1 Ktr system potassium uptake protein B [Roseobacter litoralis]